MTVTMLEKSKIGPRRSREAGHLMAGVMVMLALMLIFSTVIFQSWDQLLRRDNEAEMIFRAEEYSRAILRYRKAHSAPPVKLEQLLEPGPRAQYFLRRLYKDPLVKDGRWGLLYVGGNGQIVDPNGLHIGANAGMQGNVDQARVEQALRDAAGGIDVRRSAQSGTGQMALESEVAGGRQFAGLTIAGVKTLCTDEPFRIIDGHWTCCSPRSRARERGASAAARYRESAAPPTTRSAPGWVAEDAATEAVSDAAVGADRGSTRRAGAAHVIYSPLHLNSVATRR